jgi:nitrogen fixation protein NifZ
MIASCEAKFQWGQRVLAAQDLFNDGTYPGAEREALLVRSGERGEIVQVGWHKETNTPVYLVEFAPDRVVGCLEEEIKPI